MQERIISYKTALLAKEKSLPRKLNLDGSLTGYNLKKIKEHGKDPIPSTYKVHTYFPDKNDFLFAPTQDRIIDWLRKTYNVIVTLEISNAGICPQIYYLNDNEITDIITINTCFSVQEYKDAIEAGIYYVLQKL